MKLHGPAHPDTLTTQGNLAIGYFAAGRNAEAIALFEQVRNAEARMPEPDYPVTLNNLAVAYRHARRTAEAITLLEQIRDALARKLGPDHPDTLTTLSNLAAAYQDAGRTGEAIPLFEHVRDVRVGKLRPDHPDTLVTLDGLARAYLTAGRTAEAIDLYEHVRAARVQQIGPHHPETLNTLAGLAQAYQAAGNIDRAVTLFEEAARAIEQQQFRHLYAGLVFHTLSACYEQQNQLTRAEAWRRKWLAAVKAQAGPQSTAYATELANLGKNLLRQQEYTAAETMLRECLHIRAAQQPDAWNTFNTRSVLGGALLGQHRYAEAEPLLKEGYAGLKQREAKIPPLSKVRLAEALERLVQLYDAWGKPEQAREWRQQLEHKEKH